MTNPTEPVLTVRELRKEYRVRHRGVAKGLTAVDGVTFEVFPGETVALVGESGSGKSTVARCIVRLTEPTSGEIRLRGTSVRDLKSSELPKAYREMQMVFQDPNSSLNPRMTVRATLEEPLRLHFSLSRRECGERILALIEDVGLRSEHLARYPRQLSGGQRQRVGIARALAVDPSVVLLDEPTASLDVSVRSQVLRLLRRLQGERRLAYVFISHDLEVIRKVSDRVLVMYLGSIVEEGPTAEVFARPTHPYTRALLSAAPVAEYGRTKKRTRLSGEIPSPIDLPLGCRLASRCPLAKRTCAERVPSLEPMTPTHLVACPVVDRGGGSESIDATT